MIITEMHKFADKQKWMNRFFKAYSGDTLGDRPQLYGSNVRFFLLSDLKSEIGFVRINDKSDLFDYPCPLQIWNLTDGYVKPPYRGSGVLKMLIEYVVKECEVRMMYIETDRFLKNRLYYQSLGFNNHYSVKNGELTWAFQDDVWPYVVQRNKQRRELNLSRCN